MFEDLRNAVVKVFKDYMTDATRVIKVMTKLREEAERLVPNTIVFR